MAPHHLGGNNG